MTRYFMRDTPLCQLEQQMTALSWTVDRFVPMRARFSEL